MTALSAIETNYRGYRFRSRTEARWAVYFDADGIVWEYEREGYRLGGEQYLPDFWLPQVQMFAEVKGVSFSDRERRLCHALAEATGHAVLMLDGAPDMRSYFAVERGDQWGQYTDYLVSTYHDYPQSEGRFFASTGAGYWPNPARGDDARSINIGSIEAARAMRFEHGEGFRRPARATSRTTASTAVPAPKCAPLSPEVQRAVARIEEIDRRLPLADDAEKNQLIQDKLVAVSELNRLGHHRWKGFTRHSEIAPT